MEKEVEILIQPDGTIVYIHNDTVASDFKSLGKIQIKRASNVEPTANGEWNVDLSPVGGPESLEQVFDNRTVALAEEVAYLKANFPQSIKTLFSE